MLTGLVERSVVLLVRGGHVEGVALVAWQRESSPLLACCALVSRFLRLGRWVWSSSFSALPEVSAASLPQIVPDADLVVNVLADYGTRNTLQFKRFRLFHEFSEYLATIWNGGNGFVSSICHFTIEVWNGLLSEKKRSALRLYRRDSQWHMSFGGEHIIFAANSFHCKCDPLM